MDNTDKYVYEEYFTNTCPDPHVPAPLQTRPAAHIGRPRSAQPHRTKKLSTSSEISEDAHIGRTKHQSQSPRHRRERLVARPKIDAVQQDDGRSELEVDLSRLTCKQRVGNEQGCMLGMDGDELGGPELVSHAYLMIWSLCMGSGAISAYAPCESRLVAQRKS